MSHKKKSCSCHIPEHNTVGVLEKFWPSQILTCSTRVNHCNHTYTSAWAWLVNDSHPSMTSFSFHTPRHVYPCAQYLINQSQALDWEAARWSRFSFCFLSTHFVACFSVIAFSWWWGANVNSFCCHLICGQLLRFIYIHTLPINANFSCG